MRRAARLIVACGTVASAALVLGAQVAVAATPAVTAQALAANAAFLAYAPPPAGGAGALCLVDTGVNVNPDTQHELVYAGAVDGGTGADVDPQAHGTTMAMVAGAAGNGMIGAWPQIKIVSVRASDVPPAGQEPTFDFDDYTDGIARCATLTSEYPIHAIELALSSTIPPTTAEAEQFASAVTQADGQNIAIVAAAGNSPGAVQEPAAEPGVLPVGASTAQPDVLSDTSVGSPCNFSASIISAPSSLTLFAPGCGLDTADPFTDQATCCGNGTSQASTFVAAVIVALMSYNPSLSYAEAEQLLLTSASGGDLDVAAAFDAAGLSSVVAAGNANIPEAPASPTPSTTSKPAGVSVTSAIWRRGVLTLVVSGLATGDRLSVQLKYAKRHSRRVSTTKQQTRIRTARPRKVVLRVFVGKHQTAGPLSASVT